MKFFRVGSCLALLAAGLACTQAPQALTAPSASTGGSTADAADGTSLKVTAPALVSPVDGARAEDRRPTIIWVNSSGRYGSVGVAYDIEVSTPAAVVYSQTVGETPDIGSHLLPFDLEYDTVYSWRVRAHLGETLGPWASWASFLSPTRPVAVTPVPGGAASPVGGCAAPLSALGPGETRKPRPNDSAIARDIASRYPTAFAHSCQEHYGEAGWEYLDRTIDALRVKDGRYGYNCKRGNCNDPSLDVVSYYYGGQYPDIEGRFEVYIFDIISGHCGSNPSPFWGDVTDVTFNSGTVGRTTYPRRGRTVAPCVAAATAR